MSTGELWVQQPIFPWLVVILGFWVGTSTIIQFRSWKRIKKLQEQLQNKSE